MMIKKTVGDWLFIIVTVIIASLIAAYAQPSHAEWALRGGSSFNHQPGRLMDTFAEAELMMTWRDKRPFLPSSEYPWTELNVGIKHVSTTEDTRVNWNGVFIELRADLLRF